LEEAIVAYSKALAIKPDYADAYNNLGNALKDQGKLEEAIEAYNKALAIKPDYAEAFNNMGNALKDQGKLEEAIVAYSKALAIKPDYADAYNNLGNALKDQGKLEEAIEAYNKALAIKSDFVEAWNNGAEALEKWNKLDDLEIWLEKAFKSFETVPAELRLMKSKLLWRNKKFEETSTLLLDINLEAISEGRKKDYLSLKAKCFEKAQNFDEAFACFTQSNLLVKESKEYPKHNSEQYFQNLRDNLDKLKSSSKVISKVNSVENPEFSPTFLVGFPRSGTTLLDTILRSNTKIEVVEEQPVIMAAESFLRLNDHNDFSGKLITPELNLEAQKIYRREFNKHIDTTSVEKVYVDKLPLSLLKAPLIHQLYPDTKFILALRHPMDTILSCWMQNFKLNAAMANMVDLNRIVDFYCIAMETFKICRANYNLNVHEIRYEDLTNNFQKESEAVVQFLNLQWEPEMENYQDTALNRGRISTPSYSQVVQPIYKDAQYRWLNYRKYLEQYLTQVKPWISEFGYD
jgi:predicted O-linked N-acetylglucosamine transferase (SPINDLY family)